ncbi:AAA family ATPase [Reinekea forsetii]|uniref:AAA family ATPase n=1 Tax=Reinekea forsetii TaxID=1336806 RepID=UPI002353DCE9|nr:ATP-binding protein [Reinekea forsetii]
MAGEEYKYEVSLHNNKVLKEALYQKTSKYFSYVFVRESTEQGYRVKQQAFGFPPAQAQTLRANASLLAAAQSYGVLAANPILEVINRVFHNLKDIGRNHFQPVKVLESAGYYYQLPELSERMNAAICEFDLGIAKVSIRKMEQTNPNGEVETLYLPVALHMAGDRVFELPFLQESTGTQSAFVLLSLVLPVLMNGGLAVIDEIDNDLHPHMLPKLLDWFRFEHTNPHQAQIIFTCHTPEVINLLSKHQVYLVEKEEQCTQSWRLDEVKGVRADDNLYAKYMAGALSAVPNF